MQDAQKDGFLQSREDKTKDEAASRTAGIGIGPNIDEAEFKKRYGDIKGSANAAGIAPVIVLRRSAVTHAEVYIRIYLHYIYTRYVYCSIL